MALEQAQPYGTGTPYPGTSISWSLPKSELHCLKSRLLVMGEQLLLKQAPLPEMHPTWLCKCCCATNYLIIWPHPQLVLLLKGLYPLTEACKNLFFS